MEPPKQQQDIILDSNVIQYLGDSKISTELLKYLIELQSSNFILSISNISICELLSGTTKKQEAEGIQILSIFKRYEINDSVLIGAAQLFTLYSNAKIPNDQVSVADRIISSTSIITGSLVLTSDVNDFPRPFFKEVAEKLIFYKYKNKTQMRILQVLSPNTEIINELFSRRPAG